MLTSNKCSECKGISIKIVNCLVRRTLLIYFYLISSVGTKAPVCSVHFYVRVKLI